MGGAFDLLCLLEQELPIAFGARKLFALMDVKNIVRK